MYYIAPFSAPFRPKKHHWLFETKLWHGPNCASPFASALLSYLSITFIICSSMAFVLQWHLYFNGIYHYYSASASLIFFLLHYSDSSPIASNILSSTLLPSMHPFVNSYYLLSSSWRIPSVLPAAKPWTKCLPDLTFGENGSLKPKEFLL